MGLKIYVLFVDKLRSFAHATFRSLAGVHFAASFVAATCKAAVVLPAP